MNKVILYLTLASFAFAFVATKYDDDNIMKEKEANTFIKSRQRRGDITFERMLVRECCDDPKCNYEEIQETITMYSKTYDEYMNVMCGPIRAKQSCKCEFLNGYTKQCNDRYRYRCMKRDCSCKNVLAPNHWYTVKIQFDFANRKEEIKSISVKKTKNDNLHGRIQNDMTYSVSREVEEKSSLTRTTGAQLDTGFELKFGDSSAGLKFGNTKLRSRSRSFGETSSVKVTNNAQFNCPAGGGTIVVCETIIKRLVVTIPFIVTVRHKESLCNCHTNGLFTSVSWAELSQKTTAYDSTPDEYISDDVQQSFENEEEKNRHQGNKKYLSLLLSIFAVMIVLAVIVAVWFGQKKGYFSLAARSSYQEFDNQISNDESSIDHGIIEEISGDRNGSQLNGENSSWCLYQANQNGDSRTTVIVGSKDKIKSYAATTSNL